MKLSIGIVGLPNVGKSTLFHLLTKQQINIANYPFATIDPNVGVVAVKDERLLKLAEMVEAKKVTPAVVEFYDIAGLVKGAHKGEGLGNQFLSHIREVRAIVHIIRCFKDSEVLHVEGETDPLRDFETVNAELALKDLATVDRRLEAAEGKARTGDKESVEQLGILKELRHDLDAQKLGPWRNPAQPLFIQELHLLSLKPVIYLLNGEPEDVPQELLAKIKAEGNAYLIFDLAKNETLDDLVREAFKLLNLINFFTIGEETCSWTIKRGMTAKEAAGEIHTDIGEGFIKAEVINWEKLLEAGGWAAARQKGLLRLEGKEYLMQDGDVIEVKHH